LTPISTHSLANASRRAICCECAQNVWNAGIAPQQPNDVGRPLADDADPGALPKLGLCSDSPEKRTYPPPTCEEGEVHYQQTDGPDSENLVQSSPIPNSNAKKPCWRGESDPFRFHICKTACQEEIKGRTLTQQGVAHQSLFPWR